MENKYIIFIALLLVIITIGGGAVSASQDNVTSDELAVNEDIDIETSDDSVSEDLKDEVNNDLGADEGEYIDVNDAYVYLNQFRNETGVWQWDKGDTTKTVFNTNESNQLKPLARDLDLEATAKTRAKEMALANDLNHTRPDGTSYKTAFPAGITTIGENIAYGYATCEAVTEGWKETNDPYSGQGHRRNMLYTDFNAVGIAGYKLNGVIWWAQDFGYVNNINEGEIIYPNTNPDEPTVNPNPSDKGTFAELNELIQNATENSVIKLDKDYVYDNATDSEFKYGIKIIKSLTIDGQGHTIDAKNLVRMFLVLSTI